MEKIGKNEITRFYFQNVKKKKQYSGFFFFSFFIEEGHRPRATKCNKSRPTEAPVVSGSKKFQDKGLDTYFLEESNHKEKIRQQTGSSRIYREWLCGFSG